MRRVHILQIGDIHYPDWQSQASEVDSKDRKFSPNITEDIRTDSFRAVLKKIRKIAQSGSLDALVFVGDLTTRGQSEYLEGVFRHFSLLCSDGRVGETSFPIMLVPGNHDVNRNDALTYGSIEKFRGISKLAQKYHWNPIPLNQPVSIDVPSDDAVANFKLINTAIGSWALQNLPGFLRDKLQNADHEVEAVELGSFTEDEFAPASPTTSSKHDSVSNLVDQYYSQLDTPYVSGPMLNGLIEELSSTETHGIVVGHHNILPQKIPRISPYSEMLNAGFVRRQLLSLNKPVVYLHGHIHQDPIEIVSDPRFKNSKLVLVSAPEIQSGFNEILLFFTDHGDLMGIRVISHRTNHKDGLITEEDQCFISTLPNGRPTLGNEIFKLLQNLRKFKIDRSADLLFWNEIQDLVADDWSAEVLEDALLTLHVSQDIEIDDLSKSHRLWRIQIKGK
nr:metallophosphoesterase [uncultured Cohaesibacter sp.]